MYIEPRPARRSRRLPIILMWAVGALVVVLLIALLYDKGISLLPSHLRTPGYVVNRDGHYYAGTRCPDARLATVGVFLYVADTSGGGPFVAERALWWAEAAPPGVKEFELFATGQLGVHVVVDRGLRPWNDVLVIAPQDTDGYWHGSEARLAELANGQVMTGGGMMSWDRFMRLSNQTFGCVGLPGPS